MNYMMIYHVYEAAYQYAIPLSAVYISYQGMTLCNILGEENV